MSNSLKQVATKGILWSSIERFSVQGIQFVIMIIMARLLTPEDYGLVGMLTIFLAVSQSLIDSGFSQALIRKQNRTEVDNSTSVRFCLRKQNRTEVELSTSVRFCLRIKAWENPLSINDWETAKNMVSIPTRP